MRNNVTRGDLDALVDYLRSEEPRITQGANVRALEDEWSQWLGVRHSVFVNSGASANVLTMAALRQLRGPGEVIVPVLTWVSDIASVLHAGLEPVFVDADPRSLAMDPGQVLERCTSRTRAVFLTHVLGYNGLTQELVEGLAEKGIPLVEDCCESHGATFAGRKVGSIGWASNFSYYYAHHLTTGEGGMICTDDDELAEVFRMMRSHGMVREARTPTTRHRYVTAHPDLNPDFIFAFPAYNVRSTEMSAVLGRSQLPRLDTNNALRNRNLWAFLAGLDRERFVTEFQTEGCSSYALTLLLREPDDVLRDAIEAWLRSQEVEFRRGMSGGGNQIRQPYLRHLGLDPRSFPNVDHVHFYGWYIGNYPELELDRVRWLSEGLNAVRP